MCSSEFPKKMHISRFNTVICSPNKKWPVQCLNLINISLKREALATRAVRSPAGHHLRCKKCHLASVDLVLICVDQSWKMSNLLHGPISTNQILPREKRVNRDIFGTKTYKTELMGFLVMNKCG